MGHSLFGSLEFIMIHGPGNVYGTVYGTVYDGHEDRLSRKHLQPEVTMQ